MTSSSLHLSELCMMSGGNSAAWFRDNTGYSSHVDARQNQYLTLGKSAFTYCLLVLVVFPPIQIIIILNFFSWQLLPGSFGVPYRLMLWASQPPSERHVVWHRGNDKHRECHGIFWANVRKDLNPASCFCIFIVIQSYYLCNDFTPEPFVIAVKFKKRKRKKRIKAAFNFHKSSHPFLYCIIKCVSKVFSREERRHIHFKLLFHTVH